MKRSGFIALLGLILSMSAWADEKPIYVGGSEEMDACGAIAQLIPGEATAIYFAEPKDDASSNGSINSNQSVYVCQEEGEWLGIIVPANEKQECAVSSPIKKQTKYAGPCKQGWIKASKLEIVAG